MPPSTDAPILTVAQLNRQIREMLTSEFQGLWVAGEISDLSCPRSGHLYFSLKDESGSIRALCWRSSVAQLRFAPQDGMQVLCRGDIDVYPPRGTYQLVVRSMQLQGEGRLQAALRRLHAQLEQEGLFAQSRKRPLPTYPQRVAVVTSISGAALRDFLEVLRRRWSATDVIILPTEVQGTRAAPMIVEALEQADRLTGIDVVLVTRGGGSLEDLWSFNDERVVRSIANMRIPTVAAIGHEIDVTLADLAADVRALTPSQAGELIVPDQTDVAAQLAHCTKRLQTLMRSRVLIARTQLQSIAESRNLRSPLGLVHDRERLLDELQLRARRGIDQKFERTQQQLSQAAQKLEALSPLKVLARGYSVTQTASGEIVRSENQVRIEDVIQVRLAEGALRAVVHQKSSESNREQEIET